MDMVPRLLDYITSYPRFEGEKEFKDQLSGFTHKDLRAACSLLNLPVSKKNNKKGGYISTLVAYWKGDSTPIASKTPAKTTQPKATMSQAMPNLPHHPMPMHEASDVTQYVQDFPPDGDEQELRDQLDGCRAVILRSACVQLELRPNRKNFAKPNFVTLLVEYWKDSVAISSHASITPRAVHVPEPNVTPRNAREEMVDAKQKRTREEEKTPKKKKAKVMERSGDLFEEKVGAMAASLEKAKVVKEWAAAIEILSRVDGSAESIASIRALIDGVVESAATDL
ncbi:hypothetical protein F441_03027 [Phytophthora nicotianae CJ01A1]|uniref:Uncharacterized protein n=2 Tax=Phytophthora nicotianae TaxID=4792 RepID=W2J7Z9_PHYNI|nr:hypothetical protein L915_02911 [Phytophthora nicotianae]ETL41857.1 hypothetical protein L916_07227 [Phytophthora nicotianae]ETP23921.1 hypothetical protein F441_03027 [Phytophthora nicotianae CJ01A1]